jgi:O-antigen/teichoic acid export membrane protein
MSISKFVNPGFLLSLDLLLISLINWLFWLIVSKLVSASEVGEATTVYSYAILTSAIVMFGLEYSLVKIASKDRSRILGTAMTLQLAITVISIPILLHFLNGVYQGNLDELSLIAVGILIFSCQRYITRFVLLGVSDAKSVLVINLIGAAIQLVSGISLTTSGFGAWGILVSFFLNMVFVTAFSFIVARRSFKFKVGDISYIRKILKDALINAPTPLAKTVIYSLSIVLLASFGMEHDEVGIFYIAMMVSIVAGGFAGNIAYMTIPASSNVKRDLSNESLRLGLSLTAPLIAALIIEPRALLSIIGPEYMPADQVLRALSIGIIPYIIVINAISKFNNVGRSREIVVIGSINILVFLISFTVLVPIYGILGAAYSILIASVTAAIPSLMWSGRLVVKPISTSIASVVAGFVLGYALSSIYVSLNPAIIIFVSVVTTISVLFGLKNTSTSELAFIVKGIIRQN